ncbi:MAG TPA: NAD(P)/FAD-dependent oxidoreductase [Terriglobales bacterium]|jgi:NADH dehydrogenase
MERPVSSRRPRVVIIGAGFAGINAARALRHAEVQITLVDKKNHHTFQPLLYQVALAVLSPAEIASPVRAVLRDQVNAEVLMGEVTGFDTANRRVLLKDGKHLEYDYLIVAAGASHSYFGHEEWAPLAPGLKTLEDAIEIRRRVLLAFELAEKQAVEGYENPTPLNFVVVGAGPTGVELAGAISDIARRYMTTDFRHIDPKQTHILLLEGGPRVLPAYTEDLSASAEQQLRDLKVEVRTNARVTGIEPGAVLIGDERVRAAVVLWAAGVAASHIGKMLGVPTDRSGRVYVDSELNISAHPEVFVLGDLAAASDDKNAGHYLPGLAPVAIQMGKYAAKMIESDIGGRKRAPFHYNDKGSLATIGRNKAVGTIYGRHLTGYPAWMAWLFIHIFFLIGFRNRLLVLLEWAWTYFAVQRGARLITGDTSLTGWGSAN